MLIGSDFNSDAKLSIAVLKFTNPEFLCVFTSLREIKLFYNDVT